MTSISSLHLERAASLVNTYVPDAVRDNWRLVGTTGVMVGLCLCPLVAWIRETDQSPGDAQELEEEEEEEDPGCGGAVGKTQAVS